MTAIRFAALTALMASLAAPAAAQAPVSIQFPQSGLVSISTTRSVPLRTVLAEWARVGGSRFVNADRVPGNVEKLELINVPERRALETLLRGVSGYIVGARANAVAGASTFDRVMIVPTAAPTRQAATTVPTFTPPPAAAPFVPSDSDDDQANRNNPTVLQRQLREASERAEQARRERQAADEEEEDEPAPRTPPARPGANPFGTVQGSARPGEVTPAPPRRNQTREDD
jgi:hypothetical protein